ncbi:unknown [Crocosphaera subtropica ATCC 51142]|uniref:HTH cro/C1-type domain-containing protein n=1 Tax=Crocosphaera subtropica (strain ATCC 51142 / BH68) TaxID=43989 RepID=B1X1W7_CROS5|nr:helix-turn-helix transcriptional regulator [Crocosphaera subtropica]ACB54128.1 unknown [Crocosphaera subtropica ATCC 51142]
MMSSNQVQMGLFMPIKWRLAVLMADREIDYKELAQLTGFHEKTVSKHKNMRVMPSRLEDTTLYKYCQALKCQPGDLLVFIPDPEENVEPQS